MNIISLSMYSTLKMCGADGASCVYSSIRVSVSIRGAGAAHSSSPSSISFGLAPKKSMERVAAEPNILGFEPRHIHSLESGQRADTPQRAAGGQQQHAVVVSLVAVATATA